MGAHGLLAILLTSHSSKGGELLYRYPCDLNSASEQELLPRRSRSIEPIQIFHEVPNQVNRSLSFYSDAVLSQFLSIDKLTMSDEIFDVKVDDVQFVGYPVAVVHSRDRERRRNTSNQSHSFIVNVVLALKEGVSDKAKECYQALCKQISMAIKHEERRCCFFCQQKKKMTEIIDSGRDNDIISDSSHLSVEEVLKKHASVEMVERGLPLPNTLRDIFDSLKRQGSVLEFMNNWTEVNFCLPSAVHNQKTHPGLYIKEEDIERSIELIRPYHSVLLLTDNKDLISSLPIDSSPALVRLLRIMKPRRNLQELASDSDLELSQVFKLVSHLVYWGKAMIIYPLCELNVYVLSPYAPLNVRSELVKQFKKKFYKHNNNNLSEILAEFSHPTKLGDHHRITDSKEKRCEMVGIVTWLLQHKLIMQLHTYLYLKPSISEEENLHPNQLAQLTNEHNHELVVEESSSKTDSDKLSFLTEQTFISLRKYFDGRHHLEEIMFYENMSLPNLMNTLDRYLPLLFKVQAPDSSATYAPNE